MAFVTAGAALLAGLAGAAATGAASSRSQAGVAEQNRISQEQLDLSKANLTQQQIVQALINQRAIAGTRDSFGSSMRYDPGTNTWVSELGALPQAADRAAMQASIEANTTDPARVRLANQEALRNAALAQPYADTARRNLEAFRPKSQDELVGLLTQQATEAARQTYDPLRNDVLRSVQRTGSAAGPVLSQLGQGEAQNLRSALRDALITGMTQTDQINQGRRSGLENAAVNARTLATPQLQNPGASASNQGNALATLMAQRSTNAPTSSAYGQAGVNAALTNAGKGYDALRANQLDPNFGLNQTISGLKSLSTMFGPGGSGLDAAKQIAGWFKGGGSTGDASGYSTGAQPVGWTTDYIDPNS